MIFGAFQHDSTRLIQSVSSPHGSAYFMVSLPTRGLIKLNMLACPLLEDRVFSSSVRSSNMCRCVCVCVCVSCCLFAMKSHGIPCPVWFRGISKLTP